MSSNAPKKALICNFMDVAFLLEDLLEHKIELHILREVERVPIDGKPETSLEPEKMN